MASHHCPASYRTGYLYSKKKFTKCEVRLPLTANSEPVLKCSHASCRTPLGDATGTLTTDATHSMPFTLTFLSTPPQLGVWSPQQLRTSSYVRRLEALHFGSLPYSTSPVLTATASINHFYPTQPMDSFLRCFILAHPASIHTLKNRFCLG